MKVDRGNRNTNAKPRSQKFGEQARAIDDASGSGTTASQAN
jgi:hypothetical protein